MTAKTRSDLVGLMSPYIVKAALELKSPVAISEQDYGFVLTARFEDRAIAASVHWWDDDYAEKAFGMAMSDAGAGCVTWLTEDQGKEAPWAHDPQAQG